MVNVSSLMEDDSKRLPNYKVIILGKSASGKTKLLTRYQYDFYSDTGITTLTVDFSLVKRSYAHFSYYDTAGQDRFRATINSYFRGVDACLIVYDVNSLASFEEVGYYYNKIKEEAPDSLIYLVGCKNDLKDEVGEDIVKKNYKGIKWFTTSAKLDRNVKEIFYELEHELATYKPKIAAEKAGGFVLGRNSGFPLKPVKEGCC